MKKYPFIAVGLRLKEIRGALSQAEFAKTLGIVQQQYNRYEKGHIKPPVEILEKVAAYGNVPIDWLLLGEASKKYFPEPKYKIATLLRNVRQELGLNRAAFSEKFGVNPDFIAELETARRVPIYKEGEDVRVKNGKWVSGIAEPPPPHADEYAYIPLYDIRASAGGGAFVEEENIKDVLAFKREWIHNELHASPAEIVLLFIEGESMSPTLNPGDIVLIKKQDDSAVRDGIYVVRLEDTLLVKRLQHLPGKVLKVSSDNPAYEPFSINLAKLYEDFAIIGRVVWAGRRF